MNRLRRAGLVLGAALFLGTLLYGELARLPEGLTQPMVRTAAVTLLMAAWWVTEAIPIPATSLLPIALFPLLGVLSTKDSTTPYANHLIYLFVGGFIIASSMEKWSLHKRVALYTIRLVGVSPPRIVLGFMVATAFVSMWVSNTATAMMMLPVGLAVIGQARLNIEQRGNPAGLDLDRFRFGTALMLGIAYAASIGGVGTLIGTPPNTVMAAVIEQRYGQRVSFVGWMIFAVPLVIFLLLVTWFLLVKVLYPPEIAEIPGGRELIAREIADLGPPSPAERRLTAVLVLVALGFIVRGFIPAGASFGFLRMSLVDDATIAMLGAVALFLIPANWARGEFLLDWQTAVKIPWGVVVLFGGGLSLTEAVSKVKLANWVGNQFESLHYLSLFALVAIVVLVTIFLTEITSNTATATLLMPIVAGLAEAVRIHPYGLMVAATIACSYAFMLPVGTPPNAVVYGSGCITISQMCRAGFWLNLIATLLILLFVLVVMPLLWGLDLELVPSWVGAPPASP